MDYNIYEVLLLPKLPETYINNIITLLIKTIFSYAPIWSHFKHINVN